MLLFDRFRLVTLLHASDIAGVYLCRDLDASPMVLKVTASLGNSDPTPAKNLLREISISNKITHPNIVKPLYSFEDDEFVAFGMEYLTGGSLADVIIFDMGIQPLQPAVEGLRAILSGLRAIHQSDIVHGDLKPQNILLDSRRTPKISDFGLASTIDEKPMPFEDCIVGTVDYLAPEYILDGVTSPATDLYAFGLLACEVLTGRHPYQGENIFDTLSKRKKGIQFRPTDWNQDIPRRLETLILECLSFDPRNRPTSEELYQLLTARAPFLYDNA